MMNLKNFLENVEILSSQGNLNVDFDRLTSNSQDVDLNSIFIAVRGEKHDGHNYLADAASKKAVALVIENNQKLPSEYEGAVITVANSREFLDRAFAKFYGDPSSELTCIGITGTNGKTSITNMVEWILNAQNTPTAVMGTIDHHLGTHVFSSDMTTPGPELLQKRLREFKDLGAQAVAMEVSSHALQQRRADSVQFDIAIFTNLTRDHLDYHANMQDYFSAKQRLFDELLWKSSKFDRFAVINGDDNYGRWLKTDPKAQTYYYGVKECDFQIRLRNQSFEQTEFAIEFRDKRYVVRTPLIGLHNLYNLTAAFVVAHCLKLDLEKAAVDLSQFIGVSGRLERVLNRKGLHVFVDYAHTDDALKNVLESIKNIRDQSSPQSRIITVFGCGGDRDRGKRPIMAQTAELYSDLVVATSDNPRTENPQMIIGEILKGFSSQYLQEKVLNEVDRFKGIELALKQAREGDIVLIAGKGHEDYQIIGTEKKHFSDVEVVKELTR